MSAWPPGPPAGGHRRPGATASRAAATPGAAKPGSDVDLLVDFPESPSFEQYMDLKLALEGPLGSRVDLVTRRGLRESLRAQIEAEAQVVA
ncbi:MAG: nucleotidyltransferase domain-containing protein [Cyanobacteria bacterium]|nr:nucleotidyltransferase domain-containing protein [Cyanobacteriota bacterium]